MVILSEDYYQSVYCTNETGIIWYDNTPKVLIALPEITTNDMKGFLNSEYKLNSLSVDTDIGNIYEQIKKFLRINKQIR